MKLSWILTLTTVCSFGFVHSQSVPYEYRLDAEQHRIKVGGDTWEGLYKQDEIKTIYLEFAQSNWWNLLTAGYNSGTDIAANMTVDGVVYNQVGVGFKGQTSYNQVNTQKKSFSIKTDAFINGQKCQGYKTFNLNNCFEDATFLREYLYLHAICKHIPAAKASFVKLVINGESWGLYVSVEQMNGDYLKEWFESNNGVLWRADAPTSTGGPGGPGGPGWGDGTAALNYLGADTALYQVRYTLKSSEILNPWDKLVQVCDVLNNTPVANLPDLLPQYMDVDRTLWFLASEIAFGDDDGYVYKGKMDYYAYWESETGRLVPLEYDGNSCLISQTQNWGPFYNANNANYPLLHKLMQVPQYRQRYLAHLRTIINESLNLATTQEWISAYSAMIDAEVQADTKKLYSYNQFTTGLTTLQNIINTRRNVLSTNVEVNTVGADISNVLMTSTAGDWTDPLAGEPVSVSASIATPDGISEVNLYYCSGAVGNFTKVNMYDDGQHNDGAAGDGVYGGFIPGYPAGVLMRYYIEAAENNTAKTRTYMPVGAEHDVFYYFIQPVWAPVSKVVINEIMASNTTTAMDNAGEYDDWIELYNRSSEAVDLTGWHITDNSQNLDKFPIQPGTILQPDSYLIIWADEDGTQGAYHANFKLSAAGETITLLDNNGMVTDRLEYTQQQTDMGLARVPNGFGEFLIQAPTFNANNAPVVSVSESDVPGIVLYPNPASQEVVLQLDGLSATCQLLVYNNLGAWIMERTINSANTWLDVSAWPSGVYHLRLTGDAAYPAVRLLVQH